MTTSTNDRADLLGACMIEEIRHCDPIRRAMEAMKEDFGVYCAVGDLIGSGISNAYITIVDERAAPVEDFGRMFRGSIGCLLSTGEHSAEVVEFFDRHGIRA